MSDTVDHELRTIRFERVLDASPGEVFDAWTQPSRVTEWWDPSGAALVECTIDLRLQGSFRFVTASHAPPFQGTYAVIERPRRLEFDAMGAHGVIVLEPHARGTLMKVSIHCPSAEHFDTFLKLGVATGTSATLDNLVKLLSSRR